MSYARTRWIAVALVVSPVVVISGLAYDSQAGRTSKAGEQPAIATLARRLPTE